MALVPQVYGVWISGSGWLKNKETGEPFASATIDIAETAVRIWGEGAHAVPFDKSLVDLEGQFLERGREAAKERELKESQKAWWLKWLT